MPVCPACGFANTGEGAACGRCGLAVELFVPVREAAGLRESDPEFGKAVQEILDAVGETGAAHRPDSGGAAVLAQAARFPTLGAAMPAAAPDPDAPGPIRELPALPAAHGLAVVRRQVEEYLQIARRQGMPTADFAEMARAATASEDAATFEALGRDLFIRIAGTFTEEFENLVSRRNELARFAPTSGPDVEFESCRAALALGDLGGAQRRLRHLDETLTHLEAEWGPAQVLVVQAELLAETIRELGGDPSPALGPLREGRRLAKAGDRAGAEALLARSALALWSLLEPAFLEDLGQLKGRLLAARDAGADVSGALVELREIAPSLRRRSFVSVVGSYRRLRELVHAAPPTPGADSSPPVESAPADAPPGDPTL